MTIDLRELRYLDNKCAIVNIIDPDNGYIHIAWKIVSEECRYKKGVQLQLEWVPEIMILSFEHIPGNYPPSTMTMNTPKDYLDNIEDVAWITDCINFDELKKELTK